jgi:ATP-binding cassette subfamily B protein
VDADIIIVLEMGKILEMGDHQTLLSKKGAYYQLYKNQFFKENTKIETLLKDS